MKIDPILVQRVLAGLARNQELATIPIEELRAIKGDASSMHYRFLEREVKKTDERTYEHNASTDNVDGMGDIIKQSGWDLLRMKTGKVPLLWGHNSAPGTMGLVNSAKKNQKLDDGSRALVTISQVFEPEVFGDSEWGKHVAFVERLMERGAMPGVSVGFVPKTMRFATQEERDEIPALQAWSFIYEEQELLELSVTPIPANPYAQERKSLDRTLLVLRDMVKAGQLEPAMAERFSKALEVTEETWLKNTYGAARTIVPQSADLPWLKGAKEQAPEIEPSRVVREELSAATRAMKEATTELREARAALSQNSKTSERVTKGAEGAGQTDGDAATTSAALMSAGTSRESVTDDTAEERISTAVRAALSAAATKPEHSSHAHGTGQ
jgi:primosomal protein N'